VRYSPPLGHPGTILRGHRRLVRRHRWSATQADFWHPTGWSCRAAVSASELLRRALRADRADRGHRPDADLRRAAPTPSPRDLRCALQHSATPSGAATASTAPAIIGPRSGLQRIRRQPVLGGLISQYEAAARKPQLTHSGQLLEPDRSFMGLLGIDNSWIPGRRGRCSPGSPEPRTATHSDDDPSTGRARQEHAQQVAGVAELARPFGPVGTGEGLMQPRGTTPSRPCSRVGRRIGQRGRHLMALYGSIPVGESTTARKGDQGWPQLI